MSRVPYRDPTERPLEGPSDEELERIARACGIGTSAGSLRPPERMARPAAPPSIVTPESELRDAQARSKAQSTIYLRAFGTAFGVMVAVAIGLGLILVIVVLAIVIGIVPGIVSGVTK